MAKGINWLKLERVGLYSALVLFILYQAISMLFPAIITILPSQVPSLFLGAAFLLAIRHIIETISRPTMAAEISAHPDFTTAFNELLRNQDTIKEMLILGYTSMTWFEHIRLRQLKISKLKILLLYDDNTPFMSKDSEDYKTYSIENILQSWHNLKSDQRIKNMEIRQIQMVSSFYCGLVNGQQAMLGLLWPRIGISGLEPRQSFSVSSDSGTSRTYIGHLSKWFDSLWEVARPLM